MRITTLLAAAGLSAITTAQSPGYIANFSTIPANSTFSFGQHYAVLNLDMINALTAAVSGTPQGQAWINSTSSWISHVHAQTPPPLSIYTRIYFSSSQRPEIGPTSPFGSAIAALGNVTRGDAAGQIYPSFKHNNINDVVLQKTRYYGGAGNALEEILASQGIDTVVLSGIRTSGVIVSTAYRLFDLNYKVYVISGNVIETPPDGGVGAGIFAALAKLPADVITLPQAVAALERSGPAVY